jgi:CheY-like chemotaxis protein
LFKEALEGGGFDVDTFNDPRDTLKNFKPHLYDLIILDIVMPAMDGFKLYNHLRKVDPDINIMFLTASEKHRDVLSKEGYSKDLFLYKPISILDLLKEVRKRVYGKN